MSQGVALLFLSLVLFEVKHFVCDFVLQTGYQYRNKGRYGHPGGIVHAGLHTIASLPAVLLMIKTPDLIAAIAAAEFLVHYHTDWLKEQINEHRKLTQSETLYWVVFGADQLIHQMTYVVILAVLARANQL